MHLNSFRIARMMVVTTVATIVMLAGAGLYAWVRLDDVANVAAHAANHLEPQLGRVAEIELNITRTSLLARHLMLVRTPADQQATFAEIGEKRKAVETAVTGFRDNVSNDQARELFRELERRLAEFWTIAGKNLELTLAGRKDEAFDHLVSTLVPARNRLLDSIKVLRLHQRSLLSEAVQLAALDAPKACWACCSGSSCWAWCSRRRSPRGRFEGGSRSSPRRRRVRPATWWARRQTSRAGAAR